MSDGVDAAILRDASIVLMGVRKAKSEAKTSMRTDVAVASVTGSQEALDRVALADRRPQGDRSHRRAAPLAC